MTKNTNDTLEGEWSLRSSFKSIEFGRSEGRSMRDCTNEDDYTDKIDAAGLVGDDNINGSSINLRSSPQLSALRNFLFDSSETFPANPLQPFDSQTLFTFESSFDLTENRLRRIFKNLDQNDSGNISYEELRLGLKYQQNEFGTSPVSDRELERLTRYLDANNSGEITYEEFSEGIRLMMLRKLMKKVITADRNKDLVCTEVFDYNSISLKH
mmetsp:Transcript_5785/g.14444  ORF Transcript_5785/g.14444 Transcript_5785/m.14444 type:complete len:212 (+) Transcript_5785:165-800(+)